MVYFILIFAILFTTTELSANASTVYKVKNGDTLWDIAQEHEVSVEHLMEWNTLHSSLIFPNQQLNIEELQDEYVVKKGDTLSEIAENHNVSLSTLMSINNISSHLIYPGDRLFLTESKKQSIQTEKKEVEGSKKEVSHMNGQQSDTQKQSPAKEVIPQKETQQTKKTEKEESTKDQSTNIPATVNGKEMTVTATAYTAYCDGCSGTTYTGINLRANPNQKVIAVDPSVIPLGSKVWVEGYGEAIAGDIGGAIKGNKIDVFVEHKADAYKWGRKQVKIKVLE